MLKIENLVYSIGDFNLGPVSFSLEKGDYLAVFGPSGAGKSLLLELIAGLRFPSSGSICIDSKDYVNIGAQNRPVGMLFQDYALFPHLSVFENIAYSLRLKKTKSNIIEERVKELSEYFSIGNLLKREIEGLSGGEKQRVALARAIAYDPLVLLLDEPLSALDDDLRAEAVETLDSLKGAGQTIIHVTHNRNEVGTLASKNLYMSGGLLK
jgi:ABC-type sugar transport system ATPase subunit